MASIKFSDIIKNYESCETSGDCSLWVERLELVAQLQNIKDKLQFPPSFLSRSAFAVYQQLLEEAKADCNCLKEKLTAAFSCNSFVTYEQLCDGVLQEGEAVDVYLADLRQLVSLMGQRDPDPVLRCAFVSALPAEVSIHWKSMAGLEKMALSDIVTKVRVMIASRPIGVSFGCAAPPRGKQTIQCYNYRGTGHITRNCSSPRAAFDDGPREQRKCFVCQSTVHMANNCQKKWGNGGGGAYGSDVCPTINQ